MNRRILLLALWLVMISGTVAAQTSESANACLNWMVGCAGGGCPTVIGLPPASCPAVPTTVLCQEAEELTMIPRSMQESFTSLNTPFLNIIPPGMTQPLSFKNDTSGVKVTFASINFGTARMWISACPGTNRRDAITACSTGTTAKPNLELSISPCLPKNDGKVYYLNIQNQAPSNNEIKLTIN